MNKSNTDNMGILFPMLHSHIVHYYPNQSGITCVVRIRINEDTAHNILTEYPVTIEKVQKRLWLQVIYDVSYQEYMPEVMHQVFTSYLSRLQLMVEHHKLLRKKERIDMLRKNIIWK